MNKIAGETKQFHGKNQVQGDVRYTVHTICSTATHDHQIRLEGHLSSMWDAAFEGLTITLQDNGDTLLTGPIVDQAALYRLLRQVRDLGLPLVSVMRLHPGTSS